MKRCDDLIRSLIATLRREIGDSSFTETMAAQVEEQLRRDYGERYVLVDRRECGGQEVYISKIDRDARRSAVLREFNGRNRKEVCERHGVSKTQFYEFLKGG